MTTRQEYQAQIEAKLEEQKVKLGELRARAQEAGEDVKEDIAEAISEMEEKVEIGKVKVKELADAADDKWEEVKDSMEEGWASLSDRVKGWFS